MLAYECLVCGCIHGWIDHPKVTKVVRHIRSPGEDVWWCPKCEREHRTFDGGMLGQMQKQWREVRDLSWRTVGHLLNYGPDGDYLCDIEENDNGRRRIYDPRRRTYQAEAEE